MSSVYNNAEIIDCNGYIIKEDDVIFGIGREQHSYIVIEVDYDRYKAGNRFCLTCYDEINGEFCDVDPKMTTHEEPDWYSIDYIQDRLSEIDSSILGLDNYEFYDDGSYEE